jgi:hypothetical protein
MTEARNAEQAKTRQLSAAEQFAQRDMPMSGAGKIDQTEPRRRAFEPRPEWWPDWLFGRWV